MAAEEVEVNIIKHNPYVLAYITDDYILRWWLWWRWWWWPRWRRPRYLSNLISDYYERNSMTI